MIDYEKYIMEHFTYNSDGTLSRNDRKNSNGSYDKDGYLILKIKGKQFKAHRIVWLLNYGSFPQTELDHINRCRTDNRIENLRLSNRKQQNENKTITPNKDTGVVGIYFDRTRGLKAHYCFSFGGKTYRFRSLDDAVSMRNSLKSNSHLGL
jgi:hypothetical protein